MPRKQKPADKHVMSVVVNGVPIRVTLHPPKGKRKSWYAYWTGRSNPVSTGRSDLHEAMRAVEAMLATPGGQQPTLQEAVLSNEEFRDIQRKHFKKKSDQVRASKTLKSLLEAIDAFELITGLPNIALATVKDCEAFQDAALGLPKNWRHPNKRDNENIDKVSRNTVCRWLRELQAAFERCNRNAVPRRKCVQAVDERKLLRSNPFHEFTWIEGTKKQPRQFSAEELLSLMDFLESRWKEITSGALAFKVLLWSWSRKDEIANLSWDDYRPIQGEHHFQTVGKREVRKWFRIPDPLFQELKRLRTNSDFVFAAYCDQLLKFHAEHPTWLQNVEKTFTPRRFGEWLYKRIRDWSAEQGNPAYVHTFRKTAMQFARRGEDVNPQVAAALRVSPAVMLGHYVTEGDAELRAYSNETYFRIAAALPVEVAVRYGYTEAEQSNLKRQLHAALATDNWDLAKELTARLAGVARSEAG